MGVAIGCIGMRNRPRIRYGVRKLSAKRMLPSLRGIWCHGLHLCSLATISNGFHGCPSTQSPGHMRSLRDFVNTYEFSHRGKFVQAQFRVRVLAQNDIF